MDISYILNDLNEAQRQAVSAPPGNQLVLAGAGSGKTRVLVHRIAYLMQVEGASPYSVLSVTFTNKAAREMRARLDQVLPDHISGTRGMWVGTFHGIAHRLLKAHWRELKLPQNFQVLDSDDQLRLIKRLCQMLKLDESRWPPRQAQWFINAQKDEGLRPGHIKDTNDPYQTTMLSVYRAYDEACRQGGLVDFGELLLRAYELLAEQPDILAHYQQRFAYILVDEFQDTNTIQYAWLRILAGDACFVTAVGDDDQSIYGWRGAKIENIQRFSDDFKYATIVRLEQNYRSTALILKAANGVIQNNTGRLGKELWTNDADGEPIALYGAYNEQDEARFIIDDIQQWVSSNNPRASVAILYRSNAQSRILEEALLRENIPYRIYGGQRFYDRLEIKNALAYLRLLVNPSDDTAFERVVNTPTRGIGSKTIESIREYARKEQVSLWQAATDMTRERLLSARANTNVAQFLTLIRNMMPALSKPLDEVVETMYESSGLRLFHGNEKGEKGQARVENLDELINAIRVFDPLDSPTPIDIDDKDHTALLSAFLDSASLDAGDAQADDFEDAVQLMTLHSAKGLEFPRVFLAGVEENLFPHKMSIEDPMQLEEERRLCYVGITRAMQKLTISYAESRRIHGKESFNLPSRFIKEIPPECIHEVRLRTQIKRPLSDGRSSLFAEPEDSDGLSLGQQVSHQKFGEGVVTHVEGRGSNARIQVNFNDVGSKWMIAQYANLEPVS